MGVSTFTQPDRPNQNEAAYVAAIDDAVKVMAREAAQFAAHAQSTPNMTVAVDAGRLPAVGSLPTDVAAQNTTTISAPTTDPRKDIIYIDALTGVVGVATGTEDPSPSDPAVPSGKIAIARVNLTASLNEITNTEIDDLRALTIKSLIGSPMDIPFKAGYAIDGTGEDLSVQEYGHLTIPRDLTITGEVADIVTAPTGQAAIVDILKNGVSIYSTRPQFAAGSTSLTAGTLSTTEFDEGDRVTFAVDQVGSSAAGQKLTFTLKATLRN